MPLKKLSEKKNLLSILLIVTGSGAIAVTLLADFLGIGGQSGFGVKQIALATSGFVFILCGIGLITPLSQRFLDGWQHPPQSVYEEDEQPSTILIIAIWLGLVTGLLEGLFQTIRVVYFGSVIAYFGPEILWMALVTDLSLFVVIGLVLYAFSRRWPGLATLRMAIAILVLVSLADLLFLSSRLHKLASFLLAAGLAVNLSGIIIKHRNLFYPLVSTTGNWMGWFTKTKGDRVKTLPADNVDRGKSYTNRRQFLISTGATVLGLATGTQGWLKLSERRSLASLPTSTPNQPNVLVIVLDTVRAQSLSLYGYDRPTTPHLDEFSKTGVRFENAYSTAPWTLPSHSSIFTGRFPHQLFKAWYYPLDSTYPTLAEYLGKNGYLTAGFVANLYYCTAAHGLNRGFVHYEDHHISPGQFILSSSMTNELVNKNNWLREITNYHQVLGYKPAPMISQDFLRWLSRNNGQRPFFAFLNYNDAHVPYLPPEDFALLFSSTRPRDISRGWKR